MDPNKPGILIDQDEANTSNAPMRKRQNTDDENEAGPSKIVAVDAPSPAAPNIEQTGDIFKLDIDCYEEAFDYLPNADLASVGRTCKRLLGVAGYCFRVNYSGHAIFWNSRNGLQTIYGTYAKHFAPFVEKLAVFQEAVECFVKEQSKFHRLKEMSIDNRCVYDPKVNTESLKSITKKTWGKLEALHIQNYTFSSNFREIMNQCVKLKRLDLTFCINEYRWLDCKYPTLECFKITPNDANATKSIPMFLKLNPNIRKFVTGFDLLLKNRDRFMSTNIKLEDLAIEKINKTDELHLLCGLLDELHKRGFYKKLHLYLSFTCKQEDIDRLATVNGLITLFVNECDAFAFSALKNLEELFVLHSKNFAVLEKMANDLINLRRIHFHEASIDDIMPFIRRSVELVRIKVGSLLTGVHFNHKTGIINLLSLNREREKLSDAQKITLYVHEYNYLASKWTMKGNDFEFIRLKRMVSFDWYRNFGW